MGEGGLTEDSVSGEEKDRWGQDRSEQALGTFQPPSGQQWGRWRTGVRISGLRTEQSCLTGKEGFGELSRVRDVELGCLGGGGRH